MWCVITHNLLLLLQEVICLRHKVMVPLQLTLVIQDLLLDQARCLLSLGLTTTIAR